MLTTSRIRFKGAVFDFDNTLVDTKDLIDNAYRHVFHEIAAKFNLDEDKLFLEAESFQKEKIRELQAAKTSYNHADWILPIVGRFSVNLNKEEEEYYKNLFYSYAINNQKFSEKTESILLELKKRGKKLALLSERDAVPGMKLQRIKNTPFYGYFDVIMIAGETIPYSKTDGKGTPFLETAKLLGLETNEVLMIGDRMDLDIQNAKEVGMKAVLFTGYLKSQEYSKYQPDLVINDISELRNIF